MLEKQLCDGPRPAYRQSLGYTYGHRYQIQEKLSDKAGRQTYLAHDQQQNEPVILKLLTFDDSMTWEHFKLFEREAKTLQNLSHPAIPKYQDYLDFDSEGCKGFALVQTYINAPSLESYLQSGRTFSEAEIRQLAQSLLDILTYLHSHHPPVIHRDIKPSNILLGDRSGNHIGQVYLVDFGSVQTTASKESGTITIVGSYGYIPFEQFCGQAVPASDLYSLGMTLLYLATGIHPADLPQKQGEIQIHSTGLSRPLEQWLKQMTSSRLDRRFPDAQLALKALIHDQTVNLSPLRPKNTKVQLKHTYDTFEVIISTFTFPIEITLHFLFFSLLLICYLIALWFSITYPLFILLLFGGITYGGCAGKLFERILQKRKSQKVERLVIDENTITGHSGFTITGHSGFSKKTKPRSQINRLCYVSSYTFDHFWDSDGKKISRGKVKVESRLIIYAGTYEYTIEGLTNAEYWWIGQELSDFLDLELQVIYPTPKVPPEPSCGGGC